MLSMTRTGRKEWWLLMTSEFIVLDWTKCLSIHLQPHFLLKSSLSMSHLCFGLWGQLGHCNPFFLIYWWEFFFPEQSLQLFLYLLLNKITVGLDLLNTLTHMLPLLFIILTPYFHYLCVNFSLGVFSWFGPLSIKEGKCYCSILLRIVKTSEPTKPLQPTPYLCLKLHQLILTIVILDQTVSNCVALWVLYR